ncbi:protease pro-enzyme activation domain-containing protein [Lentilactobacillus sp. SPB1-3]|uniref:Protease pro-enzyme activation domain-containing protein n=1 Tax=Lentilactobacillus terminaliae TaxID=3003483 RepID=A0ACD5DHY2_9LACO|nr:S53 family peptidase [Lentilactobacillus sp. SPB1-3]MCZ0977025.1 S53 family peptidase [Lentilactobacillus sp. SPB1-3]
MNKIIKITNSKAKMIAALTVLTVAVVCQLQFTINVSAATKSNPETVSVVLKPRSQGKLSQLVYATGNPNSKQYHNYIEPREFANRFGAKKTTVKQVQNYFKKHHLEVKVQSGNTVLLVTGSKQNLAKAFHVTLVKSWNDGATYRRMIGTPKLSRKLTPKMLMVSGLSRYYAVSARATQQQPSSMHVRAKSTHADDGYEPNKFVRHYGVQSLYNNGNTGRSKTIGIISFANYHYADAYHFWNSIGLNVKQNRLSVKRANGTKDNWANAEETTMDVEQAGAIAPDAYIRTYIGEPDVTGMITSLSNAVGENRASVLSISWGQSEATLSNEIKLGITPAKYNTALNILFEQAAVQGISVLTASGDNGAYDGVLEGNQSGLSVDFPSSSPYVTAVGGTTLPSHQWIDHNRVTTKKERAWGSDVVNPTSNVQIPYKNISKLTKYFAGGGGGFSKFNKTPKYQLGVSGVNTFEAIKAWSFKDNRVVRIFNDPEVSGKETGRNLPDISANADPVTGYSMYVSGSKDGSDGSWYVVGGTSLVAPQMAGSLLLVGDDVGNRLGFINPLMYRLARLTDSPFTTLDSAKDNNNLYYTGQPGKLYNQATGLGTVNFGKLSQAIKDKK